MPRSGMMHLVHVDVQLECQQEVVKMVKSGLMSNANATAQQLEETATAHNNT